MLRQQLQIKLAQKLSPQQIQLMKLIQLSTLDLEQRVQAELGENPALESGLEPLDSMDNEELDTEENLHIDTDAIDLGAYLSDDDIPSYKLQAQNYSSDDPVKDTPLGNQLGYHQYLMQQLQNLILTAEEQPIANFIVGSIDESGYLRREIEDLMDDLAFTQNLIVSREELLSVLKKVQTLDPPGTGARNLQECLLLQLQRKRGERPTVEQAIKIVDQGFEAFSRKHYQKLQDRFHLNEAELKEVLEEIARLNPKPGGAHAASAQNNHIVPDFSLQIQDGKVQVELNRRNAPQLHLSHSYKDMLAGYQESKKKSKSQQEAVLFIKQKLDAAKWFIDALEQRYQTLFKTINAIVDHQRDYFLSGDEKQLKPMILKDIAETIEMDISTVSRVANSKYIDTPYGIKLLKDFFSEGFSMQSGEEVSPIEIKKQLEQIIAGENKQKPFSDQALAKLLKEKGYPVARRTVAKYREQMDLPVARLRKEL
ncbi:MAG: RNA polymerase factor sigma-54 [Flavobacteriaceae bacterium]